jgi:hypothetical protein
MLKQRLFSVKSDRADHFPCCKKFIVLQLRQLVRKTDQTPRSRPRFAPPNAAFTDDFPKPVIFAQIEKYYFTNLSYSDIFSNSGG